MQAMNVTKKIKAENIPLPDHIIIIIIFLNYFAQYFLFYKCVVCHRYLIKTYCCCETEGILSSHWYLHDAPIHNAHHVDLSLLKMSDLKHKPHTITNLHGILLHGL